MSQLGMNSDDMGADVVLMNQELVRQQAVADMQARLERYKAQAQEQSQAQTDAGLSPVNTSAETPGRSWTAGDVAKDIGIGIVEAPNAIIGGGIDAVNETMSALAQAGNWLREHGVGELPQVGHVAVGDDVVRFPKAEVIWQIMQRENQILREILPLISNKFKNKIHQISLVEGEYPFSVVKRFIGKICDNRDDEVNVLKVQDLPKDKQENLAQNLAEFFAMMHKIDYSKLHIPPTNETIDICSNMLLNPEKDDILVGIIDFANAVIEPKYLDFFPLYKINRNLAVEVIKRYNKLVDEEIDIKQTDFTMLAYIGYNLSKTENPPSYFMKLLKLFSN